jgi:hypothetical protein
MHRWFKTCRVPALLSTLRLVGGSALTIVLLGSNALPQSDSERRGISPAELARRVVTNELKIQVEDHGHWMYRLEKEESGRKQVQEIVETNKGSLSRLLSLEGRPLDAKRQQKENQRINTLVNRPDEQRKLQQARSKEAEQGARLFNILPEIFVFAYAGRQGDFVTLSFRPNPTFQPPSLEARVFHSMEGEMTVDAKQDRLTAMRGHLMADVKFGGGLLGRLEKGGRFEVRQVEVAPGQWEMVVLDVDMKGKALLLKTIGVQESERHSDFHRVADDLTLAEAAGLLNRQMVVADNR